MPEQTTVNLLDGLNAEIMAADPADKGALVGIGSRLEKLRSSLATCPDAVTVLLDGSLGALVAIHQEALARPGDAMTAIAQALATVRAWISGESDGDAPISLPQAAQELQAVVSELKANMPAAPSEAIAEAAGCSEEAAAPTESPVEAPVETPAAPAAVEASSSSHPTPILPLDTDMDILKEFIVECLDHISNGEAALLDLETNPGNTEVINTIFRAFHTLKGTSGFLGLDQIQRLSHLAENLLDRSRNGEIRLVGGYADLALKSCDVLKSMIEGLKGVTPGQPLPPPANYEQVLEQLRDPAAAGVSEESERETMRLGDILVAREVVDRDDIEQAASSQSDQPLGEVLVSEGKATATDVANALRTQQQMAAGGGTPAGESTLRVNTARLDSLIDMVGEIVIAHSMVAQDPDVSTGRLPRLQRNVAHTGKIVRSLQDLAMSLRMVPLKPTFQKMARLVRDLARKSGKKVHFVTEGEDTEIDRNMVEIIGDPLVHMIRNAVDHGVESVEARLASGKSEGGTVTLRAFQAAGNVVIELQDDGKGLDRERILAKAIERQCIAAGAELTDAEIYNLIFMPGFSTADKITDVSGRGVGMDVVKRNVESIRGRVDISSKPGQGSLFSLRLPLTMAITDAMLVQVGAERYLVPTVSISRSFRPDAGTVTTVTGRGEMAQLRCELLPLFRLHQLFKVRGAIENPHQGLLIVVQAGGRNCALMVDELLGQQQVVIKSLGEAMGTIPGVSGGAILGDGRVGLILDTAGIVALAHGQASAKAA